MICKRWFLLLLLFLPLLAFGQEQKPDSQLLNDQLTSDDIIFEKKFYAGAIVHTSGFGVSFNYGLIHGLYKQTLYQLEFLDIKHPKEALKQSGYTSLNENPKSFKLGKINNFYNINVLALKQRLLTEKARRSGVAISVLYGGGASIGILKPYYLELRIKDPETSNLRGDDQRYSEENADLFLDTDKIYGSSGFAFGLNEIRFKPGLQAKLALSFDWAAYKESVKALEVGMVVNAYLQRIPILVTEENSLFFANLYIKLAFGKRW